MLFLLCRGEARFEWRRARGALDCGLWTIRVVLVWPHTVVRGEVCGVMLPPVLPELHATLGLLLRGAVMQQHDSSLSPVHDVA